jgi:serine phosphatase RsbU (regulator of sigma subunit)
MRVAQGLDLQVAVSKVGKYSVSESGDTVEMIERPQGGLSVVLADGQRSGRAAKLISNIAGRKILSLLADGVRDGAAARAAHDYLRTIRQGKVSAEVSIISVDLETDTIVVSRNSRCPALLVHIDDHVCQSRLIDELGVPIGIHAGTKPIITEFQIRSNMYVILFSDGILSAGCRRGTTFDIEGFVCQRLDERPMDAQELADAILAMALELDDGRPVDDTSVVVLAVQPDTLGDIARRMTLRFPI